MITVTGHHDGPPAPGAGGGGGQPAPAKAGPGGAFATFLAASMEEGAETAGTTAPETVQEATALLVGAAPAGAAPAKSLERHNGAAVQGLAAKDATEPSAAVAIAGDEGVSPAPGTAPADASATARYSPQPVPVSDALDDAPPIDVIARGDPAPARPPESAQGRIDGAGATTPSAIAREAALAAVPGPHATPLTVAPIVAQSGNSVSPAAPAPTVAMPLPMQVMAALHAAERPAAARPYMAASGPGIAPSAQPPAILPVLHAAPPSVDLSAAMGTAGDPAGLAEAPPGLAGLHASTAFPSHSVPVSLSATAGLDVPRQIAVQIAHAAEAGGGARGSIELSLSPEELGRVRLRLHPSEAGLSVTITADRPETLDLMRRNIELLAREFLQIGYEGTRFDFAQGGQDTDRDRAPPSGAAAAARATAPPDIAQPAPGVLLVLGDRLDIRL